MFRLSRYALALCALACASRVAQPSLVVASGGASSSLLALPGVWTDERGVSTRLADFRGQPLILTMFYRSCQTRCPLTISRLEQVARALERRQVSASFVLVTLDPRNDTVARLAEFKADHKFPESWHLLRGDEVETRALAKKLGLRVAYDDAHIDHDVKVVCYDSQGRLALAFSDWHFDENQLLTLR
ncbi:MAG TPA: SCO family protein [Polyangiaceae bacterium]